MALSNPAFGARSFPVATTNAPTMSAEKLEELYGRPSASPVETDRMSYEDTTVKTVVTLLLVLAGGVVGYFIPALALPFALIGFVLALVNIFKKKPSAALVLAYGAAAGIFLGGLSRIVEANAPGIIFQALIGTGIVFGVTLALFASGKVRASKKLTKVFLVAIIGYGVFQLLNLVLMFTGVLNNPFGLYGATIFGIPLGIVIGIFAVLMGAYSLVLDFDFIQRGVQNRAPAKYGWTGAFGIMVTVIWIYVEILRLLAITRN